MESPDIIYSSKKLHAESEFKEESRSPRSHLTKSGQPRATVWSEPEASGPWALPSKGVPSRGLLGSWGRRGPVDGFPSPGGESWSPGPLSSSCWELSCSPTTSTRCRGGDGTAVGAPGMSDTEGVKSHRQQAASGLPLGWPLGSVDPGQERDPGQLQICLSVRAPQA